MARARTSRQLTMMAFGTIVVLYASLLGMRVLWPIDFQDVVRREAQARGLPADLVASVAYAESRFRPTAVSSRGAIGMMQIMPETAAWIAESLGEPVPTEQELEGVELSTRYGTWYLRYLLDRFGDTETALAAYNAGPATVDTWLASGSDPFPETDAFVRRALAARPIYRFYFAVPAVLRITPALRFWHDPVVAGHPQVS